MKKFFTTTLFVVLTTISLNAQYSNATMNGVWYFSADTDNYIIFDGDGNIEEMGLFSGTPGTNVGTYSVQPNGSISGNFSIFSMDFTGQLTSNNVASLTVVGQGTFPLIRVLQPGALAQNITGTLTADNTTKTVNLNISAQGEIINGTGDLNIIHGKIYTEGGKVMGYFVTDDQFCWEKFIINGSYSNNMITGTVHLDCTSVPTGTAILTRTGNPVYVGLSKVENNDGITVSPNPFNEVIIIQNNLKLNVKQVQISDINGLIIKNIDSVKDNSIEMDLSNLTSGVYFVSIITELESKRIKIIKQ